MKKSVLSIIAIAIAVITMSSCSKDPSYEGGRESYSSQMSDDEKAALDFIANGILSIDNYDFTFTVAQGTLSSSDYDDFSREVKAFNTKDEAVSAVAVPALILTEYSYVEDSVKSLLKKYKEKGGEGMMVIATVKNSKGKIVDTNTWK